MTTVSNAKTNKTIARVAGLLYLIVAVTGFFSIVYVPSQIIVHGDVASATVSKIVASRALFQWGIVSGLTCYATFVLLPLALYKLLSPIHRGAAVLMVALAIVSVPISFINLLNKLDILSLLSGANYLQALTTEELNARVMLLLAAYDNGLVVTEIFWGLWLLPFGYLVFKSGFLPRALGVLLMMGCFGYLIHSFGSMSSASFPESAIASLISVPGALGEIGTCLWLLILGVRAPKVPVVPARDSA